MLLLIMANSQVGISSFERNGVFASLYGHNSYCSSRWLARFGVPMNTNNLKKRIRISSSRTFGYGNICASSRRESGNGMVGSGVLDKELEFKPSFDGYLKAMELAKIGKEKKQGYKSNGYGLKDNFTHKDGLESSSLGRDEDTSERKKIEGNLDQQKLLKAAEPNELKNGKSGYKERMIRKSMHELHGNERSMDSVKTRKTVKTTTDRRLLKCRTGNVKPETGVSNVGKMIRPGRTRVSAVVLDLNNSKVKSNKEGKLDHEVCSSKLLQRKTETVAREEIGLRVNQMHDRPVRNYIEVEEATEKENSPTDGKLSASKRTFIVEGEDDALEVVERAAFRTCENLNEVVNKPRVSQREMEDRIQLLAKRLNGADIDMPEWMFSKTMLSAKIKFTDHTILRTIQILGKLGNWRRVLQVIEWLQTRERFKSYKLRNVYTTALDVLGKARRPVEALNVFHAMQQQMSSYPDLVAYHCIAVTLGQAGHMKELFDVIDIMRSPPKKKFKTGVLEKWDPRLEPDIVVYNAVLNACVQTKNWEGAFWVLQQLKQQRQQPSTATYGLVMEVMFVCGKYNLVHEFFRKMEKSSMPNALAYKVLVNTLWKEGKTDEAVLAVQDMEQRGIVGSAALYYDFARCLCSAGRCKEALEQIEKICKVASKPLVVTYTGLMQACLDAGNVQNAVFIFNQMKNFCSPNVVTYNIMLKAYLEHGLFEEAKELFQKMLADGKHISSESDYKFRVKPDIFTFNTMLDACLEEKRWNDLVYVYGRMLQNGCHFNSKRHLRIILEASRAGKEELPETTWKHLAQMDRIPPPPLTKERFCVKLSKGDPISAICCVTSQPESELQAFSRGAWLKLFKENAQRFRMDSLMGLLDEVTILIARSNSPNPVLQNLLTSCREYLRSCVPDTGNNLPDTVCTVQTALESQ